MIESNSAKSASKLGALLGGGGGGKGEEKKRGGGLGAPKARIGKNDVKIAAQRRFSFSKIAIVKLIFRFFFACGALNLQRYRIYEPTPYTAILREPKNIAQRVILHYKTYILGAKYATFSPAALKTGPTHI